MEEIEELLQMMARLRHPEQGCPWDREQSFETIAPYTLEEAYEVVDAIQRGDMESLCDELGDLLFQVVFHARMAEEAGAFDFGDVVQAVCGKMRRRHPHVFGDARVDSAEAQALQWQAHKRVERQRRAEKGVLAGVAQALPALKRAQKLQRRAAQVGFDWPSAQGVLEKMGEELEELGAAHTPAAMEEEMGDLLFTCVNLARHLGVDAEAALAAANRKFERRFRYMESALDAVGETPEEVDGERLEGLWREAKREVGDE